MSKIKICGLRRKEDIEIVNKYKPDFVGFICDPMRKRFISYDDIGKLRPYLSEEIIPVGVFVNAEIDHILEGVRLSLFEYIQLHGDESETYIRELIEKLPDKIKVIKAFSIKDENDIKKANESSADLILLDNGKGGTGETFDWGLINNIRPFFMAGGINISNVSKVIKKYKPYAVDVSSSVETDGYKDESKVKEIINAVRSEI